MPVRVLGADGSGTADERRGRDRLGAHPRRRRDQPRRSAPRCRSSGAVGGDAIDAAIQRALAAGIVVVAAAGNNGVPVCEQPAAADGLLCVGAVDRRGQRSVFSSFGSGLGIVAPGGSAVPLPGEDVLSTVPPDGYAEMAGTSQAAPHVTGVAALLVSLGLRGRAVTDRLLATATDLGPAGADAEYGHGLVNARAAVAGLQIRPGAPGAGRGRSCACANASAPRARSACACGSAADGRARIVVRVRRPHGRPHHRVACAPAGPHRHRPAVPASPPLAPALARRPRRACAPAGRGNRPYATVRRRARVSAREGTDPYVCGNAGSSRIGSKSTSSAAHARIFGSSSRAAARCSSAASRRPASDSKQAAL